MISPTDRENIWQRLCLGATLLYCAAFIVVHFSSHFRQPAANMQNWYYSDQPVFESAEFYVFWPLRQVGYRVPGLLSRHYQE